MEFSGIHLRNNLFVAPMAGVTDKPFRQLCKQMGAGLAVSEMVTSNAQLYASVKTLRRADLRGEVGPISVQIAGADPRMMAQAARHNVQLGAQIIDINMGCPAKKVCNVAAGSALMRDEALVIKILDAVVRAVPEVPVTLKIRTGWDAEQKNALVIARLAESAGVALLTIHGRTRCDLYMGQAEYDTIAEVKSQIGIPVIANGDIDSPQKAKQVLDYTGADGVMIGRAAQGRPWIFREIEYFLRSGQLLPAPSAQEIVRVCCEHLMALYAFYGIEAGVRIARKHIAWYAKGFVGAAVLRSQVNMMTTVEAQLEAVRNFFDALAQKDLQGQRGEGLHHDVNESEQEILVA